MSASRRETIICFAWNCCQEKRRLAAYELNKYLDLGFVPPVVERTINNYPGSLQIFVEDAFPETARKTQSINLFSDSCGDERDRDILIQRWTEKISAVGFSRAFAPNNETIPGCEILRCSRSFYGKLLNWDQAKVKTLLDPYLNAEEMRALHARVGSILWMIKKQIEMRGESAVLI
jgi:hypothetical protein